MEIKFLLKHGMLKPLFKGTKRARYDVCIYLSDGHYFGIRNLNSFLGNILPFKKGILQIKAALEITVLIVKVI